LSRGAAHAVFVEKSADATAALTKNVRTLGASNAEVLNMDALAYLSSGRAEKFDLVFLDPPFSSDLYGELCRLLSNGGWLADGARIYIEMDRAQSDSFMPDDWQVLKDKSAGNVRYMLATRIDKGSPDT
jgi:16S rRNA (guanine966-N2)-methyltransferase